MPLTFIIRRFFFAIPTVIGISIIAFSLSFLSPGDPALAVLGLDSEGDIMVDQADVERVRKELGFDLPFYMTADGRDSVERADRSSGGDDFNRIGIAVLANGGCDFVIDKCVEQIL